MRILCDANVGSRIARALSDQGHDVVRSIHALGQHAQDQDVMAFAVVERRILITCDNDFGELVFLKGAEPPQSILYVQFEPDDVSEIVPRLMPFLESESIIGHIVVIGKTADRMTLFPKASFE